MAIRFCVVTCLFIYRNIIFAVRGVGVLSHNYWATALTARQLYSPLLKNSTRLQPKDSTRGHIRRVFSRFLSRASTQNPISRHITSITNLYFPFLLCLINSTIEQGHCFQLSKVTPFASLFFLPGQHGSRTATGIARIFVEVLKYLAISTLPAHHSSTITVTNPWV